MRKISLLILAFLILSLTLYAYQRLVFFDGKLHVVFCDVGQGDGIFIRTPSGKDIVIDGGPNDAIVSCLSQHMPFWDRTIDLVELTHPHADHLNGLLSVLDQYEVRNVITEELRNNTAGYTRFIQANKEEGTKPRYVISGDTIASKDGVVIEILGPSKSFLKETSPKGVIGESKEFGSLVTLVTYGNFSVLLTGDSQIEGLSEALEGLKKKSVSVFHVPHHGSKYGTSLGILKRLSPQVAVISVGAKNRYGHPAPQVLGDLDKAGLRYFRTDKNGEIEFVSDGKGFMKK